jgi:predicted nucleotidyltransferase
MKLHELAVAAPTCAPTAPPAFDCQDVSDEVYVAVLRSVTRTLDETGLPWALLGGVASAVYGRPRWTYDIDAFVRPHDARPALEALARRGFATDELDPHWLFKAIARGVLVDMLFKTVGDLYLDEQMISRVERHEFRGVNVPVISPEDLVVIKALAHNEPSARHWHDALGVIARRDLDWGYVVARARVSRRRVASLLLYAQSLDLDVPDSAVRALIRPRAEADR